MTDLQKTISLFRYNGRYFEFFGDAQLFVRGDEVGDVAILRAEPEIGGCKAEPVAAVLPDLATRKMIVSVIEDAIARGELKW